MIGNSFGELAGLVLRNTYDFPSWFHDMFKACDYGKVPIGEDGLSVHNERNIKKVWMANIKKHQDQNVMTARKENWIKKIRKLKRGKK